MGLAGYGGGANIAGYGAQAADVQYRYNTDKATNAYSRFLSQQRGQRTLGDMSTDFGRGLPSYKSTFGQRGLAGPGVRSGSMQRSMGNFLGDYARDYGRAQQDAVQEAQNYDLQSAQMDAYLNNSLASIEQQKQNDIANAALSIEALRSYLGSLGGSI
jgi:hypothetical protein